MLQGMTIKQFLEWRHYDELEPFDEERADYRAASIVLELRNIYRMRGVPASNLDQCVVRFGASVLPDQPTSVEQARAQVRATMDILMAIYN